MDDGKRPSSLDGVIDLKGEEIYQFAFVVSELRSGKHKFLSLGKETKIIILTHSASIVADSFLPIYDDNHNEEDTTFEGITQMAKVLSELTNSRISKYEKELGQNIEIRNMTDSLYLKDVAVKPFSSPDVTINFKYLQIFSDQVVGLSLSDGNSY